ncbi:hypothetical protein DesfrDRAFT_0396 [Solidesulfovibrio fructosivorans JJ]]|uniref:Glycosyl transferase group 1 n=2 Tax=Solidesulfovibrio fructosivorans TaxID=878 RepID=E1JRZ7_SOLFR|nr:hypothetical protein DesfrDRAFT_0396 [Solidesulfovibrio fructosivorans JJ]]
MIAENDPAGTASLFRSAINRLTDHTCRLVTTQLRYNNLYPKDLHVPWLDAAGRDELADALETADVFHFHMLADEHMPLGDITAAPFLAGKKIVHHHHGHHAFRSDPAFFQKKYRELGRKNLLVSTPDLLPKLPGARWQPNLVPERDPAYMPHPRRPDGTVRLGHSPTRRGLKNTDTLLAVCQRLKAELPEITWDIIENASHADCLARKQACDIVFDHMQGYFGISSLEALSQGTPVIAGLDDWNIATIRDFFHCDAPPWVLAHDATELENALRELILAPNRRRDIGATSRAFMEDVWNEEFLVRALCDFYETVQ